LSETSLEMVTLPPGKGRTGNFDLTVARWTRQPLKERKIFLADQNSRQTDLQETKKLL